MPNIKTHTEKSKELFDNESLGEEFQKILDESRFIFKKYHRNIDHDYERLIKVAEPYGEQGLKEVILHLCMDYKLYDSARTFTRKVIHSLIDGENILPGYEMLTKLSKEELKELLNCDVIFSKIPD